ncbi:MAG: hypothetical protein RL266_1379, partial [Bacteroidota bacterium]
LLEARWVIAPLEGEVPGGVVSFEVVGHNPMLAMRIDPLVRVWGTYYGAIGTDSGSDVVTDLFGDIYLAGTTNSTAFISSNGHQNTLGGGTCNTYDCQDAFLVKFDSGGVRQWATYYGGSENEIGSSCAVDGIGNIYLAGTTYSALAIAHEGHQNTYGGGICSSESNTCSDAFLVKFNSSGERQWSTYYGADRNDAGNSCATDNIGNVYLAGKTYSALEIASGGHQNIFGGGTDAFLVKFSSSGERQWATYYGGSGSEGGSDCATDGSGNIYLTGKTRSSPNGIYLGGFQETPAGGDDLFLVKFNGNGVRLWASYYGGDRNDLDGSCAIDNSGNIYLAGTTESPHGIASSGAHQDSLGGDICDYSQEFPSMDCWDAFLVKFNSSGERLWATYYGGDRAEYGLSCATDNIGNVYLAGSTWSGSGIASDGFQDSIVGGDVFLAKFDGSGQRQWGTYYPSSGFAGGSCAADWNGNVYLSGQTYQSEVVSFNGHQNTHGGAELSETNYDAFLVRFSDSVTGITGIMMEGITVFPNPSNGIFNVVVKNVSGEVQIIVTDNFGREVLMENFSTTGNSARTIDMSGRASGIYFLRVQTENVPVVVKLVKE